MKLSNKELAKILAILEKIDRGKDIPKIPGPMGRFLRQYRDGSPTVDHQLESESIARRADGAVSGRWIGEITFSTISELRVSALELPLGEVADTLGVCEELGSVSYLRMWLKSATANAAYNTVRQHSGLRLSGDYRWTPLSRITTGESVVAPAEATQGWQHARCLKAVADDLVRPPHALEFVLDYRLGPPGIKYFRCVCALRRGKGWEVLPALGNPKRLDVVGTLPTSASKIGQDEMAALLIYSEPWSPAWMIADAVAISANDVLTHAIEWADFQRELEGLGFDGAVTDRIATVLRSLGVNGQRPETVSLGRYLLPVAATVLRGIRRTG